jgi:hypothetical protein
MRVAKLVQYKKPRYSEPNIQCNKAIGKLSKQPPGIDSKQIVNILRLIETSNSV